MMEEEKEREVVEVSQEVLDSIFGKEEEDEEEEEETTEEDIPIEKEQQVKEQIINEQD
jgi:hypothetical protein